MRTRWTALRSLPSRCPARLWDVGLVALAVLLLLVELRSFHFFGDYLGPDAVAVPLYGVLFGALLFRRRWPLATASLVLVTSYTYQALGYIPLASIEIATLAALFSAAAYGRPLPRAVPLAVMGLWLLGVNGAAPLALDISGLVIMYVTLAGAWMLGERERAHRAYSAMLEERNALLDRQRELEAAQAAASERARIARELHDVIAHGLGVVVVQAEAALYTPYGEPADVRGPLEAIRGTARSSLTEARRVLGMLRGRDGDGARAPQPGVDDLPTLTREFTAAGLDVRLELHGDPRRLEPGVDLSIYRIVEEALTNTLRHAHAAHAWITLECRADAVHLEVRDDGTGAAPSELASTARSSARPEPVAGRDAHQSPNDIPAAAGHTGHGLIGMRERVAMLHGALDAGPCSGGGYAVRVALPLAPVPVEAGA
jgi:signal transduction histidine kinase